MTEFVSEKRCHNNMCYFFLYREKRVCATTEAWSRSQCARWMCKSLNPLFLLYSSLHLCLMLLPHSSLFFFFCLIFFLDKCACRRTCLSGLFSLRGMNRCACIECECCVCVSVWWRRHVLISSLSGCSMDLISALCILGNCTLSVCPLSVAPGILLEEEDDGLSLSRGGEARDNASNERQAPLWPSICNRYERTACVMGGNICVWVFKPQTLWALNPCFDPDAESREVVKFLFHSEGFSHSTSNVKLFVASPLTKDFPWARLWSTKHTLNGNRFIHFLPQWFSFPV